jgi:outer membrane protein TolC
VEQSQRRFKLTLPMSVILIGAALLLLDSRAHALTVNEYLNQVKQESLGYKGQKEQSEGAALKSREADLFFTPQLFAEATVGHDAKPNTPSMYDEVKSQNYSLGLTQQFSFGLQGKLYYELGRTEFVNATAAINPSKYWTAAPKLELTMPLWGGGFGRTATANQEASRQQNVAEQYTAEGQSLSFLVQAVGAYWRLAAWQDVVRIQEQAMKAAQNILDYVGKKQRMNLGESADVVQARALVEGRTLELQVARNEAAEAQRNFNRFLNRDLNSATPQLDSINYASLETLELPKDRPGVRADVKALEAQLAAAKAAATLARERNRPTLNLVGNYAMTGRDEEFNEALKASGKSERDTAFVGLRFNMPLNFGATSDVKAGADKAERAAEFNRQQALYNQDADWANLVRNVADLRDNLKLMGRIEDAQKAKLESERTRLRQGRTTTYQVLLFEQDYSQAALSRAKSAAGILGLQSQIKLYQNTPEGAK